MRWDQGNQLSAQAKSHTWRLQDLAEARLKTSFFASKCDQRPHRGQELEQASHKVAQENNSLKLKWSAGLLAELLQLAATTFMLLSRGASVAAKQNTRQRAGSSRQQTLARMHNHRLLARMELKH